MAMNFPSNPTNGQEFVYGDFIYVWDGEKWTTKVIKGTGSGGDPSDEYVKKIGDTMTGNLYAPEFYVTSDIRLKSELVDITGALPKVCSLTGKTYNKNGRREAGIIAQELQVVLPEAVHTGDDEMLSVSPSGVNAILVEAIKELTTQFKELQTKVELIERSINS